MGLYERKIEVDIASRSSDRSGKQVEAAVQRPLEYTFSLAGYQAFFIKSLGNQKGSCVSLSEV